MNNVAPAPSSSEGKLRLELGERSYDILVDTNLLEQAGDLISPLMKGGKVVIVTDSNVAPLYLEKLERDRKSVV